jgi:hypothetical protein
VTSGTAGYPAEFASFDVWPDRIEVQVHSAPAHLLGNVAAGNIHGAARHGIDYTDNAHPDAESYVRGNADERRFAIPLVGAKRPARTQARAHLVQIDSAAGRRMMDRSPEPAHAKQLVVAVTAAGHRQRRRRAGGAGAV